MASHATGFESATTLLRISSVAEGTQATVARCEAADRVAVLWQNETQPAAFLLEQ